MKNLIKFEIKKITGQRFLIFSLTVFIFLNIITIIGYNHESLWGTFVNTEKVRYQIYGELKGSFDAQKIENLKAEQAELDFILSSNLKIPEKYKNLGCSPIELSGILTYHKNEIERLYNAGNYYNNLIYENKNNRAMLTGYSLSEAEKINSSYEGRKIYSYYDTNRFYEYFNYSFSSFFVLMTVLLFSSPVFSKEKECGMMILLTGTKNGRLPLISAKIAALSICTLSVSLIFSLVNIICFSAIYHFDGFSEPLYSMKAFELTPFNNSIFSFIVLTELLKAAGFIIISLFSCLMSILIKRSYSVFFVSFISVFLGMILCAYSAGYIDYLNLFNPVSLITLEVYFESFKVIPFISKPVFYSTAVIICCLFVLITIIFFIFKAGCKNIKIKKGGK